MDGSCLYVVYARRICLLLIDLFVDIVLVGNFSVFPVNDFFGNADPASHLSGLEPTKWLDRPTMLNEISD